MKKTTLLLAALVSFAVACTPKPELVIIHVNDTHSHLEPERSGDLKGHGGILERAAFVDSVRNADGEQNVLLLHAGDFNQGSSYFSELGGEVEIGLVNDLKYDCITLGNHEFDNGIEDLTNRISRLKDTKVVCANLDFGSFELGKYISPYAVIERGGFRVGIIGLAPYLSSVVSKPVSSRIPQLDNVEAVDKYTGILREEEGCDLVILLSHIGYKEDCDLVPLTHGLDLVIGGHSHTKVDDLLTVNDADGKPVRIITDWCWGREMGLLKIYK